MSDQPEISIILVSWNVRDLLIRCLASIDRYVRQPHEVIVVDNASADDTVATAGRRFPQVTWIENQENIGFARANNQGYQRARGQWLAFLNPDTELVDNPFPELIGYLRIHPKTACVGPELWNPDHSHQQSVRRFPTLVDQVMVLLKLRHLLRRSRAMQRHLADPGRDRRQPLAVDQVMGAAMVMPRWAMVEVGPFDEGYPNWFEEVDWCQRARRAGLEVIYHPGSHLIHHGGRSFDQLLGVRKHRWFLAGMNRYAAKYWTKRDATIIKTVSPISYGLTVLQTLIKPR